MRDYEAVFVFRDEEEQFVRGKTLIAEAFSTHDATVTKEEDMGSKSLAYPVKSETRGHYYLFEAQIDPEKVTELSSAVRLMNPVLRFLFVRK